MAAATATGRALGCVRTAAVDRAAPDAGALELWQHCSRTAMQPSTRNQGVVTQLMPPNYGIVDGDSFYLEPLCSGRIPQVGERVKCEAIPNTDGGKYSWRITRLEVEGTSHLAHTSVASSGAAHHTPAALTAAAGAGGHATAASAYPPYSSGPGGPMAMPHGASMQGQPMQPMQPMQPQAMGHMVPHGGTYPGSHANHAAMQANPMAGMGMHPASGPQAHQAPLGRPPPAMQGAQGGRWQGSNSDHGRAYNSAPPPTTAYVADVALAVAANAISSSKEPVGPPAADAATYGKSVALMTDSERKRAEAAVQPYSSSFGIGASLLGKMGFGAKGGGGLGAKEQGISAPVDPKSIKGQVGLGFDGKPQPQRRAPFSIKGEQRRGRSRSRYKGLRLPPDFAGLRCSWQASLGSQPDWLWTRPLAFNILPPAAPSPAGSLGPPPPPPPPPPATATATDAAPVPSPPPAASEARGAAAGGSEAQGGALLLPGGPERPGVTWRVAVVLASGFDGAALSRAGEAVAGRLQHPLDALKLLVTQAAPPAPPPPSSPPQGAQTLPPAAAEPQAGSRGAARQGSREGGRGGALLGGCWQPGDGAHPTACPASLEVTAARVVREATGLLLDAGTQWLRLAELVYLRPDPGASGAAADTEEGRVGAEAHEEHLVVYLVHAWSASRPNAAAALAVEKAKAALEGEGAGQRRQAEAEAAVKAAEEDELGKRGLDTKWDPLKGKKSLMDRLQHHLVSRRQEVPEWSNQATRLAAAQHHLASTQQAAAAATAAAAAAAAAAKQAGQLLAAPPPPPGHWSCSKAGEGVNGEKGSSKGEGQAEEGEGEGKGERERAREGEGQGASKRMRRMAGDTDAARTSGSPSPTPPALLLACRFFDRHGLGYLRDRDLEELAALVCHPISSSLAQSVVDALTHQPSGRFRYLDLAGQELRPHHLATTTPLAWAPAPLAPLAPEPVGLAGGEGGPEGGDARMQSACHAAEAEVVRLQAQAQVASAAVVTHREEQLQAQIRTLEEQLAVTEARLAATAQESLHKLQDAIPKLQAIEALYQSVGAMIHGSQHVKSASIVAVKTEGLDS
ncbi:hypothetical protein QJQ45_002725 [Haematococcus lacustris]|nr:hypothetical protein QJQ45_002725 [Haematococcus lacustris]